MWPYTPPQSELTIDMLRRCIRQDGSAWTILRDEMCRHTGAGEDNDGLDTGLFGECTCRMANSMCFREMFALWLVSRAITSFSLQGNAYHHLDRFDRIGTSSGLSTEHNCIRAVENRIRHIAHLRPGRAWIGNHRLKHLCGCNHGQTQVVTFGNNAFLDQRYLFWRHLNAQVTTRYHHAIHNFEYLVEMGNRLWFL